MAQLRRLRDDAEAAQLVRPFGDPTDDLDCVVDVALSVGPARDRQPDEVHRGSRLAAVGVQAEHDRPDLAATDAAFAVQGSGQRLAGVLQRRHLGQQRTRIDVDSVAADRLHDGDAGLCQAFAQILGRADAIAQVILVYHLAQTLRDRFEVPASQTSVSDEPFGQDEDVAALLGQPVVVHGQPAADVRQAVLLGAHGHAVGQRCDLANDVGDGSV